MGGKQLVPECLVSPSGVPLTPWTDLHARLRDSDTYLVGTIRPDSRPHLVPVLGVWMDGALYFNAKETTRKARNLTRNRHCVVAVGDDTFDLDRSRSPRPAHPARPRRGARRQRLVPVAQVESAPAPRSADQSSHLVSRVRGPLTVAGPGRRKETSDTGH